MKPESKLLILLLFLSPAMGELLSGSAPPQQFFNPGWMDMGCTPAVDRRVFSGGHSALPCRQDKSACCGTDYGCIAALDPADAGARAGRGCCAGAAGALEEEGVLERMIKIGIKLCLFLHMPKHKDQR